MTVLTTADNLCFLILPILSKIILLHCFTRSVNWVVIFYDPQINVFAGLFFAVIVRKILFSELVCNFGIFEEYLGLFVRIHFRFENF